MYNPAGGRGSCEPCSCRTQVLCCPLLDEVSWVNCAWGRGCSGISLTAPGGLGWVRGGLEGENVNPPGAPHAHGWHGHHPVSAGAGPAKLEAFCGG